MYQLNVAYLARLELTEPERLYLPRRRSLCFQSSSSLSGAPRSPCLKLRLLSYTKCSKLKQIIGSLLVELYSIIFSTTIQLPSLREASQSSLMVIGVRLSRQVRTPKKTGNHTSGCPETGCYSTEASHSSSLLSSPVSAALLCLR